MVIFISIRLLLSDYLENDRFFDYQRLIEAEIYQTVAGSVQRTDNVSLKRVKYLADMLSPDDIISCGFQHLSYNKT